MIKKISVRDTLLAIPVGSRREIKNKTIPYLKIKRSVDYLNAKGEGYFRISVAGRVDSVEVIREK